MAETPDNPEEENNVAEDSTKSDSEDEKEQKKEETKKASKQESTDFEDIGETSLGIGPSEYTQPKESEVEVVVKEPEVPVEVSKEEEEFGSTIFAIKTSIGHEKMVADRIFSRARKRKLQVFSLLSPTKLRGYVLLECVNNRDAVKDLIKGLEHVRSVVDGETTLDEIEHFLTPKPLVFGIMEGDIVEIISGPFKGEKAKVQQIDQSKEEITVELFEAMVSIPVTIRGDHVRVLEKEGA